MSEKSEFYNIDDIDGESFKFYAYSGLIKFGGGFAHFLGHALARADRINSQKIINCFLEECLLHAELFIKHAKKIEEENNEQGIK